MLHADRSLPGRFCELYDKHFTFSVHKLEKFTFPYIWIEHLGDSVVIRCFNLNLSEHPFYIKGDCKISVCECPNDLVE